MYIDTTTSRLGFVQQNQLLQRHTSGHIYFQAKLTGHERPSSCTRP